MKGIPKLIGCGIAISFFTIMLATSTAQTGSDSLFGNPPNSASDSDTQEDPSSDTPTDPTFAPGNPRYDAAMELLMPDMKFPQFDPENPTKEVILPQETKEYTNVYFDCTDEITTEMEQPCNRIMLYLAGECEDNDMWLFCGEELDNYLRNHNLEGEEFLKQTNIYDDYKLLNRLEVEQMAGMPFDEMVTRLEANQNQTR
jgi:hypothetical protein